MLIVQLLYRLTSILDKTKHRREVLLQIDLVTAIRMVGSEVSHQLNLVRLCLPQLLLIYH